MNVIDLGGARSGRTHGSTVAALRAQFEVVDGVTLLVVPRLDVLAATAVESQLPRAGYVVVVVSGGGITDPELAADLLVMVDDVVEWDDDLPEALLARLARHEERQRIVDGPVVRSKAYGSSPAFRAALHSLVDLAVGSDGPVLITGETGTGKEISARLIHDLSGRSKGAFVVVDCTTIVESLSGSELFGHERGAFTGAVSTRTGAFAAADRGTLFLDEVGELPLSLQAELLRVTQERTFKLVGGNRWYESDFRLVCATNRDLESEVEAGRFRADLYHRIAGGTLRMPALADRIEDVEELFARFFTMASGADCPPISALTLSLLQRRTWPGNVRELRQVAARVASRHVGVGPITPGDISPADRAPRRRESGWPTAGSRRGSDAALIDDASAAELNGEASENGADTLAALRHVIAAVFKAGHTAPTLQKIVSDLALDVALHQTGGSNGRAAEILGVSVRRVQQMRQEKKSST